MRAAWLYPVSEMLPLELTSASPGRRKIGCPNLPSRYESPPHRRLRRPEFAFRVDILIEVKFLTPL
jgi:hypothetical protein